MPAVKAAPVESTERELRGYFAGGFGWAGAAAGGVAGRAAGADGAGVADLGAGSVAGPVLVVPLGAFLSYSSTISFVISIVFDAYRTGFGCELTSNTSVKPLSRAYLSMTTIMRWKSPWSAFCDCWLNSSSASWTSRFRRLVLSSISRYKFCLLVSLSVLAPFCNWSLSELISSCFP